MRELAAGLGFSRLGPNIRSALDGTLNAAVRRNVISRQENGFYALETRDIGEYKAEELKANIISAAGRDWIDRDDLTRATARRLGFSRTGKNIRRRGGLITRLIEEGALESNGTELRNNSHYKRQT